MINFKGQLISPEEVVNYLQQRIEIKKYCKNILYQRIINQAIQNKHINVTSEEIQIEADKIRQENNLFKASDTLTWLTDQLISPDEWEAGIRNSILHKKLSEDLFSQEVEKYFLENRLNYDQVLLYQIVVSSPQLAYEIYYQIEEREISFYEAAHIYDVDETRRKYCGYEGKFYRWGLKPDISTLVFNAKIKEVLTPVTVHKFTYILMVEEFIKAELTDAIYQEILNKMFQEWLENELNYLLFH